MIFRDQLTPLQWRVLETLSVQEPRLFLSGGAALAGFHLGHRRTLDLDLFTEDVAALPAALAVLRAQWGAGSVRILNQSPHFVRVQVQEGQDTLVVDLVHEQVPQLIADKPTVDGVRVDPLLEILVNKLTALVGRQEERDLVDVACIEGQGLRVEDALAAAAQKDGGCTPANLAWLLSTFPIAVVLPEGWTAAKLRSYRDGLVERLTRIAHDDT